PRRGGKTAAENSALPLLRGDIIVTTDASARPQRGALKPLIASFADPTVGVASGHYVSVARAEGHANHGESWYVGYDMWVRLLETRLAGIPGAAGCFHAVRAPIHLRVLPEDISRDFAAALLAREQGLRTVSVEGAVCTVPRVWAPRWRGGGPSSDACPRPSLCPPISWWGMSRRCTPPFGPSKASAHRCGSPRAAKSSGRRSGSSGAGRRRNELGRLGGIEQGRGFRNRDAAQRRHTTHPFDIAGNRAIHPFHAC